MWILPKNYQLSSAFAQDMVESREDLTLLGSSIESSLMWRSKPSLLRTWSQRWNRVPWFQRLSLRILKPSQRISFETALTLSLEDTRASRFQQQESDLEPKTPDTYGPTYLTTSDQYDLFGACLKTSKDISALDSERSLAIWKAQVIEQRGEYLARLKSAHLTRESESTSWLTPVVQDSKHSGTNPGPNGKRNLLVNQVNWPTPAARDYRSVTGREHLQRDNCMQNLNVAAVYHQTWPTPSARDHKGGYQGGRIRNGKASFDTLDVAVQHYSGDKNKVGHLNPDWVEWLMGVPTGWTGLGSWETE